MKMEPPQLFADWYDDTTILGGYVEENQTNILHIKAFKVRQGIKSFKELYKPISGINLANLMILMGRGECDGYGIYMYIRLQVLRIVD